MALLNKADHLQQYQLLSKHQKQVTLNLENMLVGLPPPRPSRQIAYHTPRMGAPRHTPLDQLSPEQTIPSNAWELPVSDFGEKQPWALLNAE